MPPHLLGGGSSVCAGRLLLILHAVQGGSECCRKVFLLFGGIIRRLLRLKAQQQMVALKVLIVAHRMKPMQTQQQMADASVRSNASKRRLGPNVGEDEAASPLAGRPCYAHLGAGSLCREGGCTLVLDLRAEPLHHALRREAAIVGVCELLTERRDLRANNLSSVCSCKATWGHGWLWHACCGGV